MEPLPPLDRQEILETGRGALRMEADAVRALADRVDEGFVRAVELLYHCLGRVVAAGMGKSGIIARKAASTLSSTGTPAFFLHPAEGSHGDVGMLTRRDVILAFSNSGETRELLALLPVIKRLGIPLIALTGRSDSTLGRMSDVVLDVGVTREACPLNLAPTCSTTAALAMSDALAAALLQQRHFSEEQFALLHPSGSLGARLLLRVSDVMRGAEALPRVREGDGVREAVVEMTAKRLGMTGVVDDQGRLTGILTDGDLRRWLERDPAFLSRTVGEVMTPHPRTIAAGLLAVEALRVMEENKITSLFVLNEGGIPVGALHLHDLLAAGLA
ncbi:MAG: KpsF/GutQ family sugar-phosphate isomerase [Magnetococcales bacterium]|nr:KpsF/GutQ family sugar-phosphate isomerase [Magnetococcales bacterium]